jgi:DNA/RNA-binding protein KIN17
MEMFSENSTQFMDEFSREFEEGMMEIIKRKARSQRQNANQLYRDLIADKHHFHMNSTIWETLTDFVMYLGRTGKCEVDETEKGWFVTYIDRDPETLARLEARSKRERSELDSDEKHQRDVQRQVKAARLAVGGAEEVNEASELVRDEGDGKIALAGLGGTLGGGKAKLVVPREGFCAFGAASSCSAGASSSSGGGDGSGGGGSGGGSSSAAGATGSGKKMSAIESLMAEEKARKERAEAKGKAAEEKAAEEEAAASEAARLLNDKRKDYWLAEGAVVKVVNKKLSEGKYYKKKGTIERVRHKYTAHVRVHETDDLLQLDQDDLETVIPAVGGRVVIVNGRGRGEIARLLAIDEERFCVRVEVEGGPRAGTLIDAIEYEDVCKLSKV